MATHPKKTHGSEQFPSNHMQTPAPTNGSNTVAPTTSKIEASAYVPLTKFTLFPKLAPKLRLKIFGRTLPPTAIGYRMLRVSGEYTTKKPRVKNKGYIKLTLLDNIHSATAKDIGLLSACTKSPEVFVSKFHHHLYAGKGRLIRYADEDFVCIRTLHLALAGIDVHGKWDPS